MMYLIVVAWYIYVYAHALKLFYSEKLSESLMAIEPVTL